MKPFSGYVLLYIYIYKCIFMIMTTSWILFMVILRSTTGPYGRPIVEVAYGETLLFSLHRGCMGVKLGKSGWGVDMCRPCWTYPGQHQCGLTYIVLDFHTIIINIYIYIVFNLYYIKEHWWSLTLSWPDGVQRMAFDRPLVLSK